MFHFEALSSSVTENSSITDHPSLADRTHVAQSADFPISFLLTRVNFFRVGKLMEKRSANKMASSAGDGASETKRAVRKPEIARLRRVGTLGILWAIEASSYYQTRSVRVTRHTGV